MDVNIGSDVDMDMDMDVDTDVDIDVDIDRGKDMDTNTDTLAACRLYMTHPAATRWSPDHETCGAESH